MALLAIPPKLIRISVNFLTPLLTKAINASITRNAFPENTKITSVIPLDTGKPSKNEISNLRSVSLLNSFLRFMKRLSNGKIK